MSTTVAYDAMGVNAHTMPAGQHCGYLTGSGGVNWSSAQWVADPGAVRIDQSPANTAFDETADVLDVENGAATIGDVAAWVNAARAHFAAGTRPGQRKPMVYCNRSTLTAVANALVAAKLSDVPVWLADPGIRLSAAQSMVDSASGPFPVLGVQYAWFSSYDADVFESAWLNTMSGKAGNTVYAGDAGPAVSAAQERLNIWHDGGTPLKVDGLFGPGTLAAVKDFQAARKLTVDGVVGPVTWNALGGSPVSPPPPPPSAYTAPLALKVATATVPVSLTWEAPGTPGLPVPNHYEVWLYNSHDALVAGYPKATSTTGITLTVPVAEHFTAHVAAYGLNNEFVKANVFAQVAFTS